MFTPISRRVFLKSLAGLGGATLLGGIGLKMFQTQRDIPGRLRGPSQLAGHQLRKQTSFSENPAFAEPAQHLETGVVIVGGGISGLSAGWWLKKQGISNFLLLEMEAEAGGNSRSGKNAVSAYPWGAHYVPVPGKDARYVHMLFEELGVIRGYDAQHRPIFDELYIANEPQERLLKDGRWQEGLVPTRGLRPHERQEIERFLKTMHAFKTAVGSDGRKAFTIPLDLSSQDHAFRSLDLLSMKDWLHREGFRSKALHWYVNYCCRDDYGGTTDQVSAWAGIHYFAARNAKPANVEPSAVLTWPEGNGWLVNQLKRKIAPHIRKQALVYRLENNHEDVLVDYADYQNPAHPKAIHIKARHVIFAAPRFIAKYVIRPLAEKPPAYLETLAYAPWMVANVTLKDLPPAGEGAPLSWDNVSYHSPSLGYVVATHQNITLFQNNTVLTCYWPLTHKTPKEARQEAQRRPHSEWARLLADDLETMHPGIQRQIESIDVWIWGHGMILPRVGYIWGAARQEMLEPLGRIHFAHSDMSGVSIFEEAQYRGVQAAEQVIRTLGAFS